MDLEEIRAGLQTGVDNTFFLVIQPAELRNRCLAMELARLRCDVKRGFGLENHEIQGAKKSAHLGLHLHMA